MATPRVHAPPWAQRSRSARKLGAIRIKNEARKHARQLGGLFTTDGVLDGSSWADVYFLSRLDKLRVYNATLDTALYAYAERCEELAWAASERALPCALDSWDDAFVKVAGGHYVMAPPKSERLDAERRAFGGLSRSDWIDQEAARLADSGDVWVHPQVKLDFGYRFGVGLLATLPDDRLDAEAVHAFVGDFLAHGEAERLDASVKLSYPSSRLSEPARAISLPFAPLHEWAPPLPSGAAREERAALEGEIASPPAPPRPRAGL